MSHPRSGFAAPPQGGAASGLAEPVPRRPLGLSATVVRCDGRFGALRPAAGLRFARRQAGLSIVELMVGLTVGLLVIAAAASVFADQLQHTRRSVVEARLHQDLRAAATLLVRDVRRAGHWQAALRHTQWPTLDNPYRDVTLSNAQQTIAYQYSRDEDGDNDMVDAHEQFGFRVNQQVLYTRAGTGQWQSLTDRQVLRITRLQFAIDTQAVLAEHACLTACGAGASACPQATVRLVHYDIEAQAVPPHGDLRQRLQGAVRVRNDSAPPSACGS